MRNIYEIVLVMFHLPPHMLRTCIIILLDFLNIRHGFHQFLDDAANLPKNTFILHMFRGSSNETLLHNCFAMSYVFKKITFTRISLSFVSAQLAKISTIKGS